MSSVSKRKKDGSRAKIKSMGDHKEFLNRITKTLYYGQLPSLPCISMPVTEVSCEVWSEWQRGRSVRRLHADAAASITRQACVSPAALVLALLYLERLRAARPHYLARTPPADLFLVTLMVGNKFLQDDGEDEEVICSEWAASGGLELSQLKRLEIEFLSAIDWNIFVNEKSFEAGLQWLERRVALKQALVRGFFTYGDLAASCDAALAGGVARALAGAVLAGAALAALLAVLGAVLLPPRPPPAAPTAPATSAAPAAHHVNVITHSFQNPLTLASYIPNSTLDLLNVPLLEEELPNYRKIDCCVEWSKHREAPRDWNWYESAVVYGWKAFESWWSGSSVSDWLCRSSLVDPLQRWLERINQYADIIKHELYIAPTDYMEQCKDYDKAINYHNSQKCVRQWLNLSKFSALVVSVSDR